MNLYFISVLIALFLNSKFVFAFIYLKKYSSLEIECDTNNFLIFNSSDFAIPSEIYFKVTSNLTFLKDINYEFYDIIETNNTEIYNNLRYIAFPLAESNKINDNINTSIFYYKIQKDKEHILEGNGDNLLLNLFCEGFLKIENTEKDSSPANISKKFIVGIVIGCVALLLLVICIFIFYWKKQQSDVAIVENANKNNQKIILKNNSKGIRKRVEQINSINFANKIFNPLYVIRQRNKIKRKRSRTSIPTSSVFFNNFTKKEE